MTDPPPRDGIPKYGFGPRTDVRYMTRAQLFRSAWQFLLGGIAMGAAWAALGYFTFGTGPGAEVNPIILGLMFLCSIFAGMGLIGSLYLAVRGLGRSPSYDPIPVWKADQLKWDRRQGLGETRCSIELHDSEITSIEFQDGVLVLRLDAYVHYSAGEPGRDEGTGWVHKAEMRFDSGRFVSAPPPLPAMISDGTLELGERRMDNMFEASLRFEGVVRLELELVNADPFQIEGDGLSVELMDEGRYIEDFTPATS